jgi:hypothetical protein
MYPDEPTDEILMDRARQRVWSSPWFTICFAFAIPAVLIGRGFCITALLVA